MTVKELHKELGLMIESGEGNSKVFFETSNSYDEVKSITLGSFDSVSLYDEEMTDWMNKRKAGLFKA